MVGLGNGLPLRLTIVNIVLVALLLALGVPARTTDTARTAAASHDQGSEPAAPGSQGSPRAVTYDRRSFMVDHERLMILSGSIHYNRVLPSDWDRVLKLAKGMGLNTIETYFFWSFHEPQPASTLDWGGRRNITRFIQLAQDNGLYVTLRVGPYSCGEYTYGGIPTWMNGLGAQCFRCSDPVWKREMKRVVQEVVRKVEPLLLPNGGPILMLQIENEYRGTDLEYLSWVVDIARNITTAVPWILCHDLLSCTKVNDGQDKAICTINDVWMDVRAQAEPTTA